MIARESELIRSHSREQNVCALLCRNWKFIYSQAPLTAHSSRILSISNDFIYELDNRLVSTRENHSKIV